MAINIQDTPQMDDNLDNCVNVTFGSLYRKANALYNEQKYEEAIRYLKKIPINGEIANLLGSCFAAIMDFSHAEEAYFEAMNLDPNNCAPLFNIAMLYYDFFQPYEAKKYYELFLQEDPTDVVALFNISVVLMDLNLKDEAYEILKYAHTIDPLDIYIIINLALFIQYEKMRPNVALRLLEKATAIIPADAELLFNLGKLAWENGNELTCFNAREVLEIIDPEICKELDEKTVLRSLFE